MFDKELVKIYDHLSSSNLVMTQVDGDYNYFNIFLCAQCLTKLEPSCQIPEVPIPD
jgi:hypothetical protein